MIRKLFVAFVLVTFGALFSQNAEDIKAHVDTLIDFSKLGAFENSDDEGFKYLYTGQWRAKLNSSADFLVNRQLTYCKNVPVSQTSNENLFIDGGAQGNVLGIRINFPKNDYNAFARIHPVFEIESYGGEDGNKFVGYGLLKNVGIIKFLNVMVKGKNFPHAFYINLKDENEEVIPYFFGYLNFDGWKQLSWRNANYLAMIRDRDLIPVPLYPRVEPLVKVDSFTFFRNGDYLSGDFISYISWVEVEYDKAIIHDESEEINDEDVWGIRTGESNEKAAQEANRLARIRELYDLERKKMNLAEEELVGGDSSGEASPANNAAATPAGGATTP